MAEMRALIVEDREQDRLAIERILVSDGFVCTSVSSPAEAMRSLKGGGYTVVVSESHLSGTTAVDFTVAVMGLAPHAALVFLAPAGFVSTVVDAMDQGAHGYITKPINPKEVRIVCRRAHEYAVFRASGSQQDELTEISVKDALTGVFNRRFLDMFMAKKSEKCRASGERFALIMADIDHFKKFNDTNGHQAGDKILKDMAQVFVETIRDQDAVFRYGGEEFTVFIAGADAKAGAQLGEKIRSTASLYMPATVSMGLAVFPTDAADPADLIAKADAALYQSKKNGRNQLTVFMPGMVNAEKK